VQGPHPRAEQEDCVCGGSTHPKAESEDGGVLVVRGRERGRERGKEEDCTKDVVNREMQCE